MPGKTGAKEFSDRELLPMSGEHNHNGTEPSRLGVTNLINNKLNQLWGPRSQPARARRAGKPAPRNMDHLNRTVLGLTPLLRAGLCFYLERPLTLSTKEPCASFVKTSTDFLAPPLQADALRLTGIFTWPPGGIVWSNRPTSVPQIFITFVIWRGAVPIFLTTKS